MTDPAMIPNPDLPDFSPRLSFCRGTTDRCISTSILKRYSGGRGALGCITGNFEGMVAFDISGSEREALFSDVIYRPTSRAPG
jgi:hypothetical protein